MSCERIPLEKFSRCALAFVLVLAAFPVSALSQTVCHSIRGGETASQLARRITGNSRNKYQPWFQIMDASSRFIPKSQYDRIRSGWRACIVKEETTQTASVQPVAERTEAGTPVVAGGSPRPTVAVAIDPVASSVDLTFVWLGAAVVVPLFCWRIADNYMARRKTVLLVMRHYAHRFVREFERPLIQQPTEPPLRARLRLRPARGRVDILLAPGEGRRYPNLSDHRKNLEYDVVRIVRLLGDDSFVREPLYTHAEWVIVPFRCTFGQKHTGVS
jgi:hypothetical protein